jgi:TonB family protein
MFDLRTQREIPTSPEAQSQEKQRKQMLVALGLLLAALLVVVVKDRDFWLGSPPQTTEDSTDETVPAASAPSQPVVNEAPSLPKSVKSKSHPPARAGHVPVSAVTPSAPMLPGAMITASNRAALPPLEVEVVAGGQRTVLQPTNRSVKVDLQSGTPGAVAPGTVAEPAPSATAEASAMANAGERVRISADTAQMVERPVQPNYPLLAKQMKVQGSVILQALIGQEGSIQDLRVLSGPAILSTAAMDAVRQWRFRPYLQSGQPVETEARITVNFTISTN